MCHVVQLKAETLELVQELLHQNGSLTHHLSLKHLNEHSFSRRIVKGSWGRRCRAMLVEDCGALADGRVCVYVYVGCGAGEEQKPVVPEGVVEETIMIVSPPSTHVIRSTWPI